MEIKLRLDSDGRTVPNISEDGDESNTCELCSESLIDYSFNAVLTALSELYETQSSDKLIDDLLYDCEITDCALLPRTFWISANDKPRCLLEQCALEVFHRHVPNGFTYDPSISGAEWWVQIRPSPPSGRYSVLVQAGNDEDEMGTSGIDFHWDKDEDLRLLTNGSMYIHPHISTVTYLSNIGAPTTVFNIRVDPMTGEWIDMESEHDLRGFISWPRFGKHMSFDGRFLHAAPPDLIEKGLFQKQTQVNSNSNEENVNLKRRRRRVTFLVNVWLNYKPVNIDLFPVSMIDKLTTINPSFPYILFSQREVKMCEGICHNSPRQVIEVTENDQTNQTFTWPIGGNESDEEIKVTVPIRQVRAAMNYGGNIDLRWTFHGVKLLKRIDTTTTQQVKESAKKKIRLIEE